MNVRGDSQNPFERFVLKDTEARYISSSWLYAFKTIEKFRSDNSVEDLYFPFDTGVVSF